MLHHFRIYLKSGAVIELTAYQIFFPYDDVELPIYTRKDLERTEGAWGILMSEVAAVLMVGVVEDENATPQILPR